MIGKIISHYKVLDKLGEGGMGVVYKAQDTKLDRIVALKFLPKHLISDSVEKERFVHEAKAASALNHPNITTIHEIDEFEGQMFIVMEYCEGKTLKRIIEKETLSVRKVLDIGIQICEGLTIAHEKGIVHRDIKSENIMLTPRGQVKIMDFGLAKLRGATKLTKTRSTLGTAAYMSPEQAQGEEVDQRSDIFSFGVVLYELLTGRLPFEGEHQAAIIYSIINEEPQPVGRYNNQVSTELERIVFKALVKEKEERYQHIDDLLADLRRERKSLEYIKTAQIPKETIAPKPKRKLLPFIVPASIVFTIVLFFLILKPFEVKIDQERKAIAQENSLAIMYFENLQDPEDKDKIAQMITALLITGLSESPQYMQVVSSQRLYDILKLLGKEGLKVIDKTVASEVAKKAGVRWILTGKVLQTKPNIVLVSEISEATTGNIKATQRVSGATGEDVFAVVDRLSPQVATALSLPEQAKRELGKPVADVTTHSQEAYRYYLEGLDYESKFYDEEAEKSFRKALEFDSTFAMAYLRLSGEVGTGDESKEMIAKAVKYSDRASQREKHYIKAAEAFASGGLAKYIKELHKLVEHYPDEKRAFWEIGDYYSASRLFEEAVFYLNKAIELDSLYKLAYNSLAYTYTNMGDFEKAILAINKYISLAPDEANPYDTRADLYASNGKLDQAIESYKKALEIKSDFYVSLLKQGNMYLFKREYAKAESCYRELAGSSEKEMRSYGRSCLALIPLYQGKFKEALTVLDNGIAADKMEQVEEGVIMTKHGLKEEIYYEEKDLNRALNESEIVIESYRKDYPYSLIYERADYAKLLAENNDFEKAEDVAEALKKDIEEKDPPEISFYWWTVGCIEFARGNLEESVANFEKAAQRDPFFFVFVYSLARAYLETGRLGEAVAQLEKALRSYDVRRLVNPIWAVKGYYFLGLAYEKSGWNKKAIEKYEEFLDIWKDADPGIPEVEDAKERVKKLKAES
jgi:serine/threonine protein kinase/predicted Zn-dependent protease